MAEIAVFHHIVFALELNLALVLGSLFGTGGEQVVEKYDPLSPDPIRLGGVGKVVADQIEQRTGIETRCTVLGHVQRGGPPVPEDRVLATEFGHAAVEALMQGKTNRLIVNDACWSSVSVLVATLPAVAEAECPSVSWLVASPLGVGSAH